MAASSFLMVVSSWTEQVDTPTKNPGGALDEVVTVQDPTHPLFGRTFRVAAWPTARPGRTASASVTVFLERGDIQLHISVEALAPRKTGHSQGTKITSETVGELLSTARSFGVCPPSTPAESWDLCPTTSGPGSSRI